MLKLVAAVRDGHMGVLVPDSLSRWLRLKPIRPPIALYFEGRRIRVLKDVSGREPSAVGCDVLEVNGRSFSARGEFMTAVFANKRGVFIGEESGAGITGNTSGLMIALKLPNSGITISIPMIGYYLAGDHGPHPERGILADHEVIPTVEDILAGRDPVMEFALELARRHG